MSDHIWFTDCLVRCHVENEDHVVLEFLMPSGHETPVHAHQRVESIVLLEGGVTLRTPQAETVLAPGDGAAIPGGVLHQLTVTSAGTARALVVAEPAFARFVRSAGAPAERASLPVLLDPPDVDRLVAAGIAHGMTFAAGLSDLAA